MDVPCAQTLEALEEFIQTQRSLLARTQSDIEKLRALKSEVVDDPQDFIDNLEEKLDSPSFRLSAQTDDFNLNFPKKIHWDAFVGHDISPLQHLHHKLVESNRRRTHPSKTQTSELSDVQRLVKEARKEIIDPVFVRFPPPSPPSSDDEPDPEILKRQREHEKIRELKKMKIRTSGLKLPGRGMRTTAGVFIRHDVEDESMEVDISEDPSPPPLLPRPQPPPPLLRPDEAYHHPLDANSLAEEDPAGPRPDASSVPLPQYHFPPRSPSDDITSTRVVSNHPVPAHAAKSPPVQTSRTRRSSRKNANAAVSSSIATDGSRPVKRAKLEEKERLGLAVLPPPSTSSTSTSTSPSDVTPIALPSVSTPSTSEGGGRGGAGGKGAIGSSKPKPETYKQAWSVSEQHLLEQLLEEIPDGEKFRWQKISRAMGGRRTPRQVASRVQKYFEKLKRFGVG